MNPPSANPNRKKDSHRSPIAPFPALIPLKKWKLDDGSIVQSFKLTSPPDSPAGVAVATRFPRSPDSGRTLSPPSPDSRRTLSPSPRLKHSPTLSKDHQLARRLISALTTGSVGHRMSAFGSFITEVPSRIGHNIALDAAVACLVHAHSSLIHNRDADEIAPVVLYLRAIQKLQICLEDRVQGLSPNTLCASVLLSLVEALAGPRKNNQYLAHVGGAGRLMELGGPAMCQDPFAKKILQFNRGGIIITSVYQRRQCFLTSPEWRDVAFDKTGLGPEDCLHTDLLHKMADFPAILRERKDLEMRRRYPEPRVESRPTNVSFNPHEPPLRFDDTFEAPIDPELEYFPVCYPNSRSSPDPYSESRASLLNRLQRFKDDLHKLGVQYEAKLRDGSVAFEMPSMVADCPIRTAFHFTNSRITVAYNCFWALVILTNKIIMKFLPAYDQAIYELDAECRTVAYNICKTWEQSWENKPIGAFHTGFSFIMAHEFVEPNIQEWIVDGLNALLNAQKVDVFRWSNTAITDMSGRLSGDGADLVIKSARK